MANYSRKPRKYRDLTWQNGVKFKFSERLRKQIDRRMQMPIRIDGTPPIGNRKMVYCPTIWRLGGDTAFTAKRDSDEKLLEKQVKAYMSPVFPRHPLFQKAADIGVYPDKTYWLDRKEYSGDPMQKNIAISSMLDFEARYYQKAASIEIPKVLKKRFSKKQRESGQVTLLDIRKVFGTAGRICLTEERDSFFYESNSNQTRVKGALPRRVSRVDRMQNANWKINL